ncbi:MAG: tetratricopeptide repeat protein [Pirellulaceae bacterium]|nr:tetratricopeptide repeat protein [Pirellulaceae bacterium]
MPLRRKLLFSALTTLTFFVLLEGLLAVAGVQPESDTTDRFVGFSSRLPLMQLSTGEDGKAWLTTAPNKRHWFNHQAFPKHKPAGTQRIFCMGGSTTYGHPYWDETSFAGWLREYLPVVDPSQKWEVINAGGISYASYRVAALMEELAEYEPDLFVVYSAHNEFLERRTYANMFERSTLTTAVSAMLVKTRVWTAVNGVMAKTLAKPTSSEQSHKDVLPAEVDEVLNHTIGPVDYHRDPAWTNKVLTHYEHNLRRMVAIASQAGAKILFITPASNEKDCSPFKSEHGAGLSEGQRQQFQELLQSSQASIKAAQFDQAEQLLKSAVKMDPQHAEAHYRLGQVWLAMGQTEAARQAFDRALNEDICPLRATREITEAVRAVARATQVPMVDFESKLRALCQAEQGRAILGQEYFLDHVHPTIDINRRLALWIIDQLQHQKLIGGKSVTNAVTGKATGAETGAETDAALAEQLQAVRERVLGNIDQQAEALSLRNLAKVLHWAGKYAEAMPRARDTLELLPGDPESRYIVASCLSNMGQVDQAIQEYELLFADGVGFARAYQPYGELLAAQGQFEQAKAYLLLAILRKPDNASAFSSLGDVHLRLGETEFAEEAFREARRLTLGN